MGYGVVRPTLGGLTRDVVGLSLAYFVAASALDLEANLGKVDDLTSTARLVLVAPVAFLDADVILWIFTALSRTLAQTQARRQEVKFELYRRFTNALAVCVVASVGWIFYEMWFKVTDMINEKWEGDWTTRVFGRRSRSASPPPSVGSGDLQRTERGTRTPGRTRRTIGRTTARRWEGQGVQLTKLGKATMASTPGKSVAVGQTPDEDGGVPDARRGGGGPGGETPIDANHARTHHRERHGHPTPLVRARRRRDASTLVRRITVSRVSMSHGARRTTVVDER